MVWFQPDVALPEDEITCAPDTADALFGPGVAQRLLITPETAWLQRLLPGALAAALDETSERRDGDDVFRSTPYTQIYLLRLTGGPGVGYVCDVIGASPNVRLVYPEPSIAETGIPTQYSTNQVFVDEQEYLRAPKGINAEPAWAKGYTGSGIQAGIVDTEASFSGTPYVPRLVPVPPPPGTASASSAASMHGLVVTGVLGCPDNAKAGIGAAPDVILVFAGAPGAGTGTVDLAAVTRAIGELMTNGRLKAGDVVNVSLGLMAGLDIRQPYAEYAALLAKAGTWQHPLITEMVGTEKRPSAVLAKLPLEFESTSLKLVNDFTNKGITVVVGAGNGLDALCVLRGGSQQIWVRANLGANVGGPWRVGASRKGLVDFRHMLATMATHSLDRSAVATFADGGGIVVASGHFSQASNGMIDNFALNHGNRVDCYASLVNAQSLGFGPSSGPSSTPSNHPSFGGTSVCAPVIAGVAAVVQGIVKAQFNGGVLRPAIIRALLSDPDLGTPTVSGSPVGVMPDLAKLMKFLEKPKGKRDELLKAVAAQQQNSVSRVTTVAKALSGAVAGVATGAAAQKVYVHDPYTMFTRPTTGLGSWQPLPLAAENDLFMP